jgi:hypothetical protein
MTRGRACIYCLTLFKAAALTAEAVLPAALGGRLLLERAACSDCAVQVRQLTDDFLSRRFEPTTAAMGASPSVRGVRPGARVEPKSRANEPSRNDWRLAHRAAAKILYCYLLLELGETALMSPPLETLRKHVTADGPEPWTPRWEISHPLHSPSPRWHVLSFDAMPPSAAAIGLFGTIWFRFRFDFEALAPHGRLVALDAARGARGLAVQRQRGTWRHRSTVRWGWSR